MKPGTSSFTLGANSVPRALMRAVISQSAWSITRITMIADSGGRVLLSMTQSADADVFSTSFRPFSAASSSSCTSSVANYRNMNKHHT